MVHGWDTHGLPIEQQVIKETRINRHALSPWIQGKVPQLRGAIPGHPKKEFKRLGSGDCGLNPI